MIISVKSAGVFIQASWSIQPVFLKVLFFREHHQAIGFTRVFRLLQRAQKVSDVVGGIFIAVNVVMSFLILFYF